MNIWLIMIAAGLITYATRLSFIIFFGRREIPETLARALRFVPPAVFSAIILPELLIPGGEPAFSLSNPRLLAGLIAALVAWRTRNILLTIVFGMGVLWVLQAVLGGWI